MESSIGSNASSKERLKWTKELHDLFEKAVIQIGGPDRATPKCILRVMAIPGLTIFHVKSHLQKYRMSICTKEEDDYTRGKYEKISILEMLPNFSATSGVQLNEALHIQIKAQRRLNEQVEAQKSLKVKMEAQSRFLEKILDEFKNRKSKPHNSPISSFPSLSEESDLSYTKEFESDSEEAYTSSNGTRFSDDFQAPKRIKLHDNFISRVKDSSESQRLSLFSLLDNGMHNTDTFSEHGIGLTCTIQTPLTSGIYNPLTK